MSQSRHEAIKIRCDHPGCTSTIIYIPRRDGFKESITQGWTLSETSFEDYCATHKPKPVHPTPWTVAGTSDTWVEDANGHSVCEIARPGGYEDARYIPAKREIAQRIVDAVNKAAET